MQLTEAEVRAIIAAKTKPEEKAQSNLLSAWQVRDIRTRLGLTQREAADLLGVTERTWQRWEKGRITRAGSKALSIIKEARL